MSDKEKYVDESWKETAANEKEILSSANPESKAAKSHGCDDHSCGCHGESDQDASLDKFQINFLNYITSLGFQALIFLGEIPHPMTNEIQKNLDQAKLLIDTLVMLRDKTKGNLAKQEDDFLNATIYETQMKYVEAIDKESL